MMGYDAKGPDSTGHKGNWTGRCGYWCGVVCVCLLLLYVNLIRTERNVTGQDGTRRDWTGVCVFVIPKRELFDGLSVT